VTEAMIGGYEEARALTRAPLAPDEPAVSLGPLWVTAMHAPLHA
jgi:hypothetical protein